MAAGYGYMLSEPVRVHWRGWESDTHRLQHEGWQVSAHEDVCGDKLTVAIRHPETGMTGVSYAATYHYNRLRDPHFGRRLDLPFDLQMEAMGRPIYSQALARFNPDLKWRAVDARPRFEEFEPRSIEDIVHFASIESRKDVIIRPESVPELMDKILKLQEPMREKHFQEQAKQARVATQVHARLISLAG